MPTKNKFSQKFLYTLIFIFGLSFILITQAKNPDISRYKSVISLKAKGIGTPKVVQFIFPEKIAGSTVLLDTEKNLVYHSLRTESKFLDTDISYDKSQGKKSNKNGYIEFPVGSSTLVNIWISNPVTINQINISLAKGIIAPKSITLYAKQNDSFVKILNEIPYKSKITFPDVKGAKTMQIKFHTDQLLRIQDIKIPHPQGLKESFITFFAQPNREYKLFFDARFGSFRHKAPYQPLKTNKKTPRFKTENTPKDNPDFDTDYDDDGIPDSEDLCPSIVSKNLDVDQNGRGDECDDPDQDGYISDEDNCPFVYNPSQSDIDDDTIGDECDDTENRWSENQKYLLYFVFGFLALGLMVLVIRSMRPQ